MRPHPAKRRITAQRKFAQGVVIPSGYVNNNSLVSRQSPGKEPSSLAPDHLPQRETSIIQNNITAKNLLDIVSFQNIHPHKEPVVLLERIESAPLQGQNGTTTEIYDQRHATTRAAIQNPCFPQSQPAKTLNQKMRLVKMTRNKIVTRSSNLGKRIYDTRRQTAGIVKRKSRLSVSHYDTEDETPLKFLKTRAARRRESQSGAIGLKLRIPLPVPQNKITKGLMTRRKRPQRLTEVTERRVLRDRIIGPRRWNDCATSSSDYEPPTQLRAPQTRDLTTPISEEYYEPPTQLREPEIRDLTTPISEESDIIRLPIRLPMDKIIVPNDNEVDEMQLDEEVARLKPSNGDREPGNEAIHMGHSVEPVERFHSLYYGNKGITQWIDTKHPPLVDRRSCAARRYGCAMEAARAPPEVRRYFCQQCTRCSFIVQYYTASEISGTPRLLLSPAMTDIYDFEANEEQEQYQITLFRDISSLLPKFSPQPKPAPQPESDVQLPVFHKPRCTSNLQLANNTYVDTVIDVSMADKDSTIDVEGVSSRALELEPPDKFLKILRLARKPKTPARKEALSKVNKKRRIANRSKPQQRIVKKRAVSKSKQKFKNKVVRRNAQKTRISQAITSNVALSLLKMPYVALTPYDAVPANTSLNSTQSPNVETSAPTASQNSGLKLTASKDPSPQTKLPSPNAVVTRKKSKASQSQTMACKNKSTAKGGPIKETAPAPETVVSNEEVVWKTPTIKTLTKKAQGKVGATTTNKHANPGPSGVAWTGEPQAGPSTANGHTWKAPTTVGWPRVRPSFVRPATPSVASDILPMKSNKLIPAPTFCPTEEEFNDPIAYFEKVLPQVVKYGIFKVKAPHTFKPSCQLTDVKFRMINQYLGSMFNRWGPATRELAAIKAYLATQNVIFNKPPLHDGIEMNLPLLYHVVQRLGGLKQVIEKKRWSRVADEMHISKDVRNTEKSLDSIYVKYLLPYDTLSPFERQRILAAVEKCWSRRHQRMMECSLRPLRRQHRLIRDTDSFTSPSDDDEDNGDDPPEVWSAVADAEDCVGVGRPTHLEKFKKLANTAMKMYFPYGCASVQDVETKYWHLVLYGTEHVCVYSASIDTTENGHGFSNKNIEEKEKENNKRSKKAHPWNLKALFSNPRNVLRSLGSAVGVTAPTLHLGMVFSTSCWHRDPHGLPWVEYMHSGPPKIWYGIPDAQSASFRSAVERLCPTSCQNKSIWLPSDITMIPPELLSEHGVSLSRVVQNPGEFVFVLPKAYSCSISTGLTISESVYFATESWLDKVTDIFRELRLSCEPATFSLDNLLVKMAADSRLSAERRAKIYTMFCDLVKTEVANRKALADKGVPIREEQHKSRKTFTERGKVAQSYEILDECEVCRTTLYLSKVKGITSKNSSWCLEDALAVSSMRKFEKVASRVEVHVYYTNKRLEDLKTALRNKCSSSK